MKSKAKIIKIKTIKKTDIFKISVFFNNFFLKDSLIILSITIDIVL